MKQDGILRFDNATVLVTLATFLLLLGCLPLALRLDERIDRNRPMYADLARMTVLQDKSLLDTGKAVPVELAGGESTQVNDVEFVASDGVSVVVSGVDGDTAYCITVRNEHGAESDQHCS
ncbi:hypothetical protein [Nocardioides sp. Soil805]|uniref:hypothetical protein n=1 Tax=Nocardioides sp. Soil805 TaxID=1736416 RepID=UPI000702F034|nr:hypothetical protein [Nocardioides sp. Soil805]KRF32382.1 hypothetical protein ASG94_18125 [Nocardioides sp. Soil805]